MAAGDFNQIHQIFYNEKTRDENDKGFLPMDNLSNERQDWSEYWPIRKFIASEVLKPGVNYGFFSPKFRQKTNLTSSDVHEFIGNGAHDVVVFSPYFDQSAYAINIFEQAVMRHREIYPCFVETFKALGWSLDIRNVVMTSLDTVFCNFFVAKRHVWEAWFAVCEKIFSICEDDSTDLARMLNAPVKHSNSFSPAKVFVIERIISGLLVQNRNWKVKVYDPMLLPTAPSRTAGFRSELCQLDALKIAYRSTGFPEYIREFKRLRADLSRRAQASTRASPSGEHGPREH